MKKTYNILWAGNDESWEAYLGAVMSPKAHNEQDSADKERPNRLLTIADSVAIISVHGTLTNAEAWYNEFFGLVAYSEIVDALYQAALNPDVKEILLDVASGGGAVNGVLDAVSAVEKTSKVKKVTAFTSSVMCSAAYWLAAPAHERYASAVATVGSIGIVIKHAEHSKMAEMEGIKETIIRAGDFKQLANASEPLSARAEADLQAKAEYIYSIFVDSVATHLGVAYRKVDAKMADGKEFIGQQAADVGLIDGVASFEDVFGIIRQRILSSGGTDMKKRYIGAAAMAAAAAGIEEIKEFTADGESLDPNNFAVAANFAGNEGAELLVAAPAHAETHAPTAMAPSEDLVATLKAQVKEKDDALLETKVELAATKTIAASLTALKSIVADVVNNMTVALGGSKDEKLSSCDPAALASMYETTAARTREAFKVGGIAAAREETDVVEKRAPTRYESALNSVSIKNKA